MNIGYPYKSGVFDKSNIPNGRYVFMDPTITLLGTGGGRHTTMFQARSTGGFLLQTDGGTLHMDPGPGALTNMCQIGYDLRKTDAVVVSHCHPDHYSDAASVIEGMTYGGWVKRGSFYGTKSVIKGHGKLGPCMSQYHLGIEENVSVIAPGDELEICGVRTSIKRADHSDPCNVGFMFHTENGIFSYVSDTAYSDDIADQYAGTRVLFLPVTTPDDKRIKYHMCTEDAVRFVERIRPELTVFIHLGIVILKHDADAQARMTQDSTGCKVIAGRDLMRIHIGKDSVNIEQLIADKPEWNDAWNLPEEE